MIEHATQRVRILGARAHPTAAWLTQAVLNLCMDLQDAGCPVRFLIRDRDAKYPPSFDVILADAAIRAVPTGVHMRRMNAVTKRWTQTCRHELPDRMLIWNQAHLLHSLRQYETHYHEHRPHRGINSARPLRALPQPVKDQDQLARLDIRRPDRLGGIIHEYHHAA